MKLLLLIGRILYSLIFLVTIISHFSANTIGYAQLRGIPAPTVLVPFSGALAFAGAVSIILGYKAKLGAWLIIIFLVPVTLMMHDFWNVSDAMQVQIQMAMFMKNISMLGAALLITYFGSGPLSLDTRTKPD